MKSCQASIFSDHNGLKIEINLEEKTQKHSNVWKLNNMLLNDKWINNQLKEEIKSTWKQMNTQQHKTCERQQKQFQEGNS